MNFIDIIILIPLLWFAYKGFTKGLIIELATLLALLAGIYIASHFSNYTADFLRDNLGMKSEYMNIISFSVTFLAVIVLVMIFGKSLEKVINLLMLSFINKIAGALFGLVKVAFIISVFFMILGNFDAEEMLISQEHREGSLLYNPVKKIAPAVFPAVMEGKNKIMEELEESSSKSIKTKTED
jgi:membrane protein required for colicin V production